VFRIEIEKGAHRLFLPGAKPQTELAYSAKDLKLPLNVPLRTNTIGAAQIRVQLTVFYCREDNTGTCQIKTLIWRVPIEIVENPSAAVQVKIESKVHS
jgi:hypothetical protein